MVEHIKRPWDGKGCWGDSNAGERSYQVAVTRVIAVLGQSKKNSIENKGGNSLVLSYFDHVHFIVGGSSFTFDVKGGR